jgi:Arc/MetJ-type ribon-helix-helix transcriptional regulator
MTEKTFTHAGVSTLDGVVKARFANDAMRVKVLQKGGHTNIDMTELMSAMTKAEAVASLLKANFDNGDMVIRAALEAELDKRAPKAASKDKPKKEAKKPKKAAVPKAITLESIKAKAAPQSTKTKAQIEAELAKLEDAPY